MIRALETVIDRFVDRTETIYECRNCGKKLTAEETTCTVCDSTEIAVYTLPPSS